MHKITEVTPGEGYTLHITYGDGATVHADVSGLSKGDPGERGRSVAWPGELDLDADVFRMHDNDPDKPHDIRTLANTPPLPADPISLEVAHARKAECPKKSLPSTPECSSRTWPAWPTRTTMGTRSPRCAASPGRSDLS